MTSSAEIDDPTTGTFAATGNLNTASTGHSATLLSNGKVLIAGGTTNVSTFVGGARTELYDLSAKSFSLSASLTSPRQFFVTTLLSTGQVLVIGGYDNNNQILASSDLYDPATATVSIAGNMNNGRSWHSATSMGNGLILIAGGSDQNGLDLTSAETYQSTTTPPPPVSLQITPGIANIAIGGTQQFTAVDSLGYPRLDVIWAVSDPSIASVTTNDDNAAIVTGIAAGQVTLTANAEGVTAQEQVAVLSQASYTPGTTIWSAPPPAGYSVQQLAQAVPSADGPDLYSISTSTDGTQSVIQALKSDGRQMSQNTVSAVQKNAVPDGFGGLIVTSCPANSPMTVTDFDATGQPIWQIQSALVQGFGYMCIPPNIAVTGNGTAYVVEPTAAGFPSVTIASPSGYVSSFQFPPSPVTKYGRTTNVACCVGPPMVNIDGTVYIEHEVRNDC